MKKDEIISELKKLNLPQDFYVVFGSCPMAVAGIREAQDIDLFVSEAVLQQLREQGWQELVKTPDDKPLTHDIFEAHSNWDFSPYRPTLAHLRATATMLDGIPFVSLEEVRKWKAASGGPKALADVALIDAYLERQGGLPTVG